MIYSYYSSPYHEIFLTPGISPFNACSLKHIRHSPNLLIYARARPHTEHLLRSRVENFCG